MDAKEIIRLIGGTAKTAELCNVTQGAVSQWIKNGIPESRLMFLKLARPDVFGNDRRGKRRRPPKV